MTNTNTIKVELTIEEIELVYALLEAEVRDPWIGGIMGKLAVAAQQHLENENV
jgi:hypothetical protein